MDSELQRAICEHCPVVWFHPDEKYFPASWEYLITRFPLLVKGKPDPNLKTIAQIRNQLLQEAGGKTPLFLLQKNAVGKSELLLEINNSDAGCDGYKPPADPKQVLYGDPQSSKQVITAYTAGVWQAADGIKFIDVIYSPYYCWNGTVDYHSFDAEEISVRFQYTPASAQTSPYTKLQDDGIVAQQGKKSLWDQWIVTRVAGSAHGNFLWYPTQFPNGANLSVEFDETGRVVFYSALASHAMYSNSAIQKRILGFGNDFTGQGLLWKPSVINLFVLDKTQEHLVLDVMSKTAVLEADPLLLMGSFCGECGNQQNSQNLVQFKRGVVNLVSAGDGYLKFTNRGGAVNQIGQKLEHKLVIGGCIMLPISFLMQIGLFTILTTAAVGFQKRTGNKISDRIVNGIMIVPKWLDRHPVFTAIFASANAFVGGLVIAVLTLIFLVGEKSYLWQKRAPTC